MNFKDFIKTDKNLFRKNEKKIVIIDHFKTNNLLKKFGWKPKISLKDGLENTIKWYVENSN